MNLLYDATFILNSYDKKMSCRSGIFFVAINVLKELCNYKNITIYIFSENPNMLVHWEKIKQEYFKNLDCSRMFSDYPNLYDRTVRKIQKTKEKYNFFLSKHEYLKIFKLKIKLHLLMVSLYFISRIHYNNIDVFLSPIFTIPDIISNNKKIKKYIILHDIIPCIFPEKYKNTLKENTWFSKLLKSLNSDDRYFANSFCTKKDFLRQCPALNPHNVIVTPLGCDKSFTPRQKIEVLNVKNKYNIPSNEKYLLSLCNIDERKNLIRAINTFIEFIKKYNIKNLIFVLAGAKIQNFSIINKNLFQESSRIVFTGYVDDEDLPALYSGAEWFVYTSQYEGFGLPPLEAMSCGTAVITSNNSSLPEVVGDAGQMIDWDSDEQHIAAYEKYYFDKKFRAEMVKKGLERSKQFSWEKCVNIMTEEFNK